MRCQYNTQEWGCLQCGTTRFVSCAIEMRRIDSGMAPWPITGDSTEADTE